MLFLHERGNAFNWGQCISLMANGHSQDTMKTTLAVVVEMEAGIFLQCPFRGKALRKKVTLVSVSAQRLAYGASVHTRLQNVSGTHTYGKTAIPKICTILLTKETHHFSVMFSKMSSRAMQICNEQCPPDSVRKVLFKSSCPSAMAFWGGFCRSWSQFVFQKEVKPLMTSAWRNFPHPCLACVCISKQA